MYDYYSVGIYNVNCSNVYVLAENPPVNFHVYKLLQRKLRNSILLCSQLRTVPAMSHSMNEFGVGKGGKQPCSNFLNI